MLILDKYCPSSSIYTSHLLSISINTSSQFLSSPQHVDWIKFILYKQLMKEQPKENRTTYYQNIIPIHNNDDFFSQRANQLKRISSYHMLPIDALAIGDYSMVIYLQQSFYNVDNLISNKIEMPPQDLQAFIWQITKLMLNCEIQNINHFRLYPKAITFKEKYVPTKPFFIMVKDFSLGKEFQTVKEGKTQEIFEYLHPDLSILNKIFNFGKSYPQYDIWSLGIILYKLIYFVSPFCKSGKNIFSKTILREYLAAQYQIKYPNKKYEIINRFINKCLSTRSITQFKNWQQIKRYILEQEQIYHQLDFQDQSFQQMAQIHLKLMVFFSNMYCFIIDQCRDSPNPFWRIPIKTNKAIPFQILISQFTLTFMMALQERFNRLYSSHFFLLNPATFKSLVELNQNLQSQIQFKKYKWADKEFKTKTITKSVLSSIQNVCVKMKIQASQQNQRIDMEKNSINQAFDSKRIKQIRSAIVKKKKDKPYSSKMANSRKVWKTVQILYDYCSQVLEVVRLNNGKTKYIFEELYINSIFDAILQQEFKYNKDLSSILKKIYKSYLNA